MKRKKYKSEFTNLLFHVDQLLNNTRQFYKTKNYSYATHAMYHEKVITKIIQDNNEIYQKYTKGI